MSWIIKEELESCSICNIYILHIYIYIQPIAHAELAQKQGAPTIMLAQNRFLRGQDASL